MRFAFAGGRAEISVGDCGPDRGAAQAGARGRERRPARRRLPRHPLLELLGRGDRARPGRPPTPAPEPAAARGDRRLGRLRSCRRQRTETLDLAGRSWTRLESEPSGLADLARVNGLEEGRDTAFARAVVHSAGAQAKRLEFGFSDRVRVYLNGRLLFRADDSYRSRDYRFLGSIGWWDALWLPLEEGRNELVLAVSEELGGWGVQARFPDPAGLTIGLGPAEQPPQSRVVRDTRSDVLATGRAVHARRCGFLLLGARRPAPRSATRAPGSRRAAPASRAYSAANAASQALRMRLPELPCSSAARASVSSSPGPRREPNPRLRFRMPPAGRRDSWSVSIGVDRGRRFTAAGKRERSYPRWRVVAARGSRGASSAVARGRRSRLHGSWQSSSGAPSRAGSRTVASTTRRRRVPGPTCSSRARAGRTPGSNLLAIVRLRNDARSTAGAAEVARVVRKLKGLGARSVVAPVARAPGPARLARRPLCARDRAGGGRSSREPRRRRRSPTTRRSCSAATRSSRSR